MMIAVLLLAACGEATPKRYIAIHTAGISFDKAHSEATLAVVLKQLRPPPEGSKIEMHFTTTTHPDLQQGTPAASGQLTYNFDVRVPASEMTVSAFHAKALLLDAGGQEIEKVEADIGGLIDKHDMPRHSDMIPDRERQVRQYNDEGF